MLLASMVIAGHLGKGGVEIFEQTFRDCAGRLTLAEATRVLQPLVAEKHMTPLAFAVLLKLVNSNRAVTATAGAGGPAAEAVAVSASMSATID